MKKTPPFTVGRGPVPRHAAIDQSVRAFQRSRGTGPRATVCKAVSFHRRARACPSPCYDREGNGLCRCAVFAQIERSRGKPARMRVWHPRAPALRSLSSLRFTVGRGPVPRHATIAGDRPPRYGPGRGSPLHAPFGIRRSRTTVSCP